MDASLTRECMRTQWFTTCLTSGDSHAVRILHSHCGRRRTCPRCAYLSATSHAEATYRFIEENIAKHLKKFKLYTMHIVLTLPHELDDVSDVSLGRCMRSLLSHYQEKDEEAGYLYVVQNDSSSKPFERHKHVHVWLLNAALVRDRNGRFYAKRRRPYFEVEDYSLDGIPHKGLRNLWKQTVECQFRFTFNGEADVHVQYSPFSAKQKQIHWLRYMYRYQVWDVFTTVIRKKKACGCDCCVSRTPGSGGSPVYVHCTALGRLLFRKQKATWGGYLSNVKRKTCIRAFTIEPKTVGEIRKWIVDENRHCPICHAEMVEVFDYSWRDEDPLERVPAFTNVVDMEEKRQRRLQYDFFQGIQMEDDPGFRIRESEFRKGRHENIGKWESHLQRE